MMESAPHFGHNNVTAGRGFAVALCCVLILAGCAGQATPQSHEVAATPIPAAHKVRAPRKTGPKISPADLIGLSETKVAKLLGPPLARAASGMGESWRYRYRRCALTVTFYLDLTHNEYDALSSSATGTDGSERQLQRCVSGIAQHDKPS